MPFDRPEIRTTKTGYQVHLHRYAYLDCSACPVKEQCTQSDGNRQISISWNYRRLKAAARLRLTSEKGVKLRSRRGWEVEGVFGQIKYNRDFRRFMLRGLKKFAQSWACSPWPTIS